MNDLLKRLCEVQSASGEEWKMKEFITTHVAENRHLWKTRPTLLEGEDYQDCVMLIFGKPEVAAIAHMDTTGFSVRYQDQLVPIGGPEVSGDETLRGEDDLGEIECQLVLDDDGHVRYAFGRGIATGTSLVYKSKFLEDDQFIQSPYLDNRIGIYNLLKIAETLENGALVFSCMEEHGGGLVPLLVKYLYENFSINKMFVSDVTWVTEGVHFQRGVVISYRDSSIPRKSFINEVIRTAKTHNISYQTEVEAHGASDGREIQASPYPIDWCFIGPPVEHVHTDHEKIARSDLDSMIIFYKLLMRNI
jgi:putative aminopeptidase FrvX